MNLVNRRKKSERRQKKQPNHVNPVDSRSSAFRHMGSGLANTRPGFGPGESNTKQPDYDLSKAVFQYGDVAVAQLATYNSKLTSSVGCEGSAVGSRRLARYSVRPIIRTAGVSIGGSPSKPTRVAKRCCCSGIPTCEMRIAGVSRETPAAKSSLRNWEKSLPGM